MEAPGQSLLSGWLAIVIATLLADENRWVTGQRIEVSGGMFL